MWFWIFPVDSPHPQQFLSQCSVSTMSSCLIQSHFSNRFLHCINYIIHFLHQQQIFTYSKLLIYNFFLQLHSVISSSWKVIYYVYLYVTLFSFLSKSGVQVISKSCLPCFVSWETLEQNWFSKILDKVVTDDFFTVPWITYYFPSGILFTWRQCKVAVLCNHFL